MDKRDRTGTESGTGYASYRRIPYMIKHHVAFDGNSMRARRGYKKYDVYSFDTLIGYAHLDDGPGYVRDVHYSRTTSRQQNILRAAGWKDVDEEKFRKEW